MSSPDPGPPQSAPPYRLVLGRAAEDLAARHLESEGATLLLRNFRRRTGELDLVASHGGALLVIEVRLRSREDYGGGAASVDAHKQRRIIRTTQQLLQSRRDLARWPLRFDVMVVTPGTTDAGSATTEIDGWRIEWIRHAFSAPV
ncbi:MAG: YraN family protein [Gammaproteobacteria bacterium]